VLFGRKRLRDFAADGSGCAYDNNSHGLKLQSELQPDVAPDAGPSRLGDGKATRNRTFAGIG
jgi:hypothetical protein